AKALVEQACATLNGDLTHATLEQRAAAAGAGTMGGVTVATGLKLDEEAGADLREFYDQKLRPFLEKFGSRHLELADRATWKGMFQHLRVLLPPNLHETVDDLENLCEEKRELDQQTMYHRVLHGWLLVHIPLSYAVLLLGAIHAVVALRY